MGGKEVAMTHVDQLLEEYLRVINSKDDEIHGLIRRLEERRCELKKKEDTYKMDVANAQQDLEKARRDIRKMSQKNKKYEETIDQLVKHNEAMKVSVTDMQQKLSEAEKSIEENRVLQRHELEEVRRQHRVEVQALQAERDKLKAEETCVHSEKVAAQRAVEACEAWEKELNEKEARHEELKRTVAELRREMESMVTAKKYMDALADCEESFRAQKTAAAAEIDDLNKRLSKAKQSVGKCQSELEELGATNAKLEKRLTEASREEEKVRQMLTAEQEMRKNLCASHQREMELAREANEKTTAKLTATVEQLQRGQTKVQTLEQQLTDVTEALERERRRGGEEREKMSSQLIAMQAKLTEHQLEAERRQRKLEDQSAELKEVHATLATTKEGSMHRTSELKEKLTHALTEKDHIREDRDRLIFELKDVQHQLSSLKERFSDEKRTLTTRLEDATITIDRMKDQLKEKEHQQQASSAAEEKRLQELTWLHRNELADSKRASENEVNDLRQRLNSTSVQLVEEVANSKAYQRELQAAHESVRRSHEECEQRVSEAREAAKTLEDVRRESMSLREELAKQKQMTEAALENGARLRRSLENMESESAAEAKRHESISVAFVDAKESLEATRSELAQLKRELAKAECEIHKKDSESSDLRLQESQKRIEQLERDIANMQQERQHHLASIEKLREVRESAEAMGRDAKEELQRLHAELQQKTTEYERVTQHAKDVEELAKRSSEELEREISRRDSTIGSMQQEILRLAEERTKVAVLEERLSHQADLSRRDVDALQNRISLLEKELDGRDVQLRDRITEAQEMAEQLRHFQNRVGELEETVMHKEKKHSLRKEALRKALEQVDAAAEKKAEAENILEKAKLSREKSTGVYKKEVERMQQEVREAREAQRAAELRLATQEEALAEMTKTAGINQTIHERHLSRMKEEQSSCFAKSADELNETLERINALAHDLGQTRKALREAEDAKQEALQYAKDAQRRMTTSYARLVSNMAEDVLMTKEMFGDFAIAAITRSFYQLSKISHNGWDIAVSFGRQTSEEFAQERSKMQREMAQLKQSHTEELQAAAEERNKEMSKLALKHGFDIAKLRQEIVEVTEQSSRALDAVVKEHQHKEEQFQRDKTELERLRLEVAHREDQIAALREQLRGFEHRSEAERAALDQEKRTLQQQQERIRRRLDDCTMEQNQSEVEVRELRSELSAMQQVLQEKENVLASERERTRQESRRLTALTAAKETLHGQVEELRRQIQALQLQLSVARQGAQCRDHTAVTQQSRLEERVSELTKSLNAVELEKRRLGRQTHSDEKKIAALERELAESRKREAELSSQLQARKAENSALKERCANLESLKNIGEVTLAETRMREKDLLEKIEELRTAQQLMQLCFDKQQEQLEHHQRKVMDEVRDGINYAWKGAMRSAKKGLMLTKSALHSIPVDRLRVPGKKAVASRTGMRRRFFQRRYGVEIDNERGERIAAAVSDVESEGEEEPLTDEQLRKCVDKKYFDSSYEAMKYEVTHMDLADSTSGGNSADEAQRQRQATEAAIRELRMKCDIVSATLKKRVLANSKGFVNGVEEIRLINDRLLETSSDCKKGRNIIRKAKNVAAERVKILLFHRKRENCKATLSLLEAMRQLCWKRNQLMALIEGGRILEAVELLHEQADIEQEDRIKRLHCMHHIIDEWKEYRDNKETLRQCQEAAITVCLTSKFIPSNYRNAFEASQILGTSEDVCGLVVRTLWQSAVYILTKSLIEVSDIKEEDVSIADIAAAIHPDHLMLCLCQMSAKMMDFLFLFATVRKIHEDNAHTDHSFAKLHSLALQDITKVGRKLGQDLVEKITLVLEKLQLDSVDMERVLHVFFVVSMLIESISILGLEKKEQASARSRVKASLVQYIKQQFQEPKGSQILHFMEEDTWTVWEVSALELQVVMPLHPETYRRAVKEVKKYLSEASIDAPGSFENPFYATHMLMLQDASHTAQTETFREDILRRKAEGVPSLLTFSSAAVANVFLEYVARIVARFAPLAIETIEWSEDLVSLYVYTVADNFFSISRAVRLEHQVNLSASTQATLTEMRAQAERAARQYMASMPAVEDDPHGPFPPRVLSRIRSAMVSQTQQYALVNRAVAGQSCITLVYLLEAAVRSVAPLLPPVTVEQRLQRCSEMKAASEELLHLGLHRLCQAIFPMEDVIQSISKLRANEKEVQTSGYVKQLVDEMAELNAKRQAMPTPEMDQLFIKRFIFAVETMLLREYSKLAKKKLSDAFIMQLSVDAQSFLQHVGAKFGKTFIVLPDLLPSFVKSGFIEEKEKRLEWVKLHHANYSAVDIVQWFSAGDRTMKSQLEELLEQVKHRDAIPVAPFR